MSIWRGERCHVGRRDTWNRLKLFDIWVEGQGQLGLVIKAEVVQGEGSWEPWPGEREDIWPTNPGVCQVGLACV